MPAYVIANVKKITDPAVYKEYLTRITPMIFAHGGKFLALGGSPQPLQGNWNPNWIVILEFENLAKARAWWDSKDQREMQILRQQSTETDIILVEGT
jgi:uncharacterized protein (DUF1330 family)